MNQPAPVNKLSFLATSSLAKPLSSTATRLTRPPLAATLCGYISRRETQDSHGSRQNQRQRTAEMTGITSQFASLGHSETFRDLSDYPSRHHMIRPKHVTYSTSPEMGTPSLVRKYIRSFPLFDFTETFPVA